MRRIKPIDHEEQLPVVDHLDELRSRLLVTLAAFLVAFGLTTWQNHLILEILNAPLPGDMEPITLGPSEPFVTTLKNSAYAAVLLALPILLYQVYAFVAPAFGARERRRAVPLLLMAPVLFVGGVVFCYLLVLPPALDFLLSFNASEFDTQLRASDYYGFAALTMAATGIGFQLPIGVLVITRLGCRQRRDAPPQSPLRDPGDRGDRGASAHSRPGHARPRDGPAGGSLRARNPPGARLPGDLLRPSTQR